MDYRACQRKILGLTPEETAEEKLVIYASGAMLIEGHKGVVSYAPEKVVIRRKQGKAWVVVGENLQIAAINPGELYLIGKVSGVTAG